MVSEARNLSCVGVDVDFGVDADFGADDDFGVDVDFGVDAGDRFWKQ